MAHSRQASLQDTRFHLRPLERAIEGQQIPDSLGLEVAQLCVVRGIRYHADFAHELRGLTPRFTRALHAQDIMYNKDIPSMTAADDFPYCIWYPAVPSRETCRRLVARYPQMKYQIGRVCAVAGYDDVYHELELLPEVAIAEEARENGNVAIFTYIAAHPVKYAVFDDYARSMALEGPPIAHLKGDTCVTSLLELKQAFTRPHPKAFQAHEPDGFERRPFDITEDMCIALKAADRPKMNQEVVLPLLYSPLPVDLPTVDKDLLILSAAYHGDIDRYSRLRRPFKVKGELACLVRGIYHNPFFAKFWSLQPANELADYRIRRAINARFIMSNDLSRITANTPQGDLPYCIWFPQPAYYGVYVALARLRPDMQLQAARACIVANYQPSYETINPPHDTALVAEAQESPNSFYLQDLEDKQAKGNSTGENHKVKYWKFLTIKDAFKPSTTSIPSPIEVWNVRTTQYCIYDGIQSDMSEVEVSLCTPDIIKESGLDDVMLRYP